MLLFPAWRLSAEFVSGRFSTGWIDPMIAANVSAALFSFALRVWASRHVLCREAGR
jgi:hypothetical protein